jgi:cellulose biosynthesis protein BcsQ
MTPYISFFSYKGGVGRTLAVLGVCRELVGRGLRVLVVDFDLEAPGLTLLPELGADEAVEGEDGAVEWMAAWLAGSSPSSLHLRMFRTSPEGFVSCEPQRYQLALLPAGDVGGSRYAELLAGLKLRDAIEEIGFAPLERLLEAAIQRAEPDVVVIDSRTGMSTEAMMSTGVAQVVVVLSALNEQSLRGTGPLTRVIAEQQDVRVILVASPVPWGEWELLRQKLQRAQELCGRAVDVQIPYLPRLALDDRPLQPEEAPLLQQAYATLVDKIADAADLTGAMSLPLLVQLLAEGRAAEVGARAAQLLQQARPPLDAWLLRAAAFRAEGERGKAQETLIAGADEARARGLDDGRFSRALNDLRASILIT